MAEAEKNGTVSLAEAQQMLESFSAVNLDEVAPETVTVAFREFVPEVKHGFRIEVVHKEIDTYVPMFLFNRMLTNQKRVARLRKEPRPAVEEKDEPFDLFAEDEAFDFVKLTDQMVNDLLRESDPAFVWQAKEVLSIWRLTPGEQDMTMKRLLLGLDMEKIEGLFTRFFGAMLRQRTR